MKKLGKLPVLKLGAPSRQSAGMGSYAELVGKKKQVEWDQKTAERRHVYKTTEWKAASKEFLTLHPWCAAPGCDKKATITDHKIAHGYNMTLFWDRSNWQPLCFKCHQSKRGKERHGENNNNKINKFY